MKVASLFTGVGGFDLAFHRAGHQVVFQCESVPYRQRVLARHWPGVDFCDDIRDAKVRTVDLVCGGFPCQDLSIAGQRAGLAGERSGLFYELARVADESLGDGGWLLLENVPGLLSSDNGRDFGRVLAQLWELGFHDLSWRLLDSQFFGVPQRRRRVFILARRSSGTSSQQVLLESEGSSWDREPSNQQRPVAAARTGWGTPPSGRELTNTLNNRFGSVGMTYADVEANLATISGALTVNYERNPGSSGALVVDNVVRKLTPTECERLQGFPDGWTIPTGPSLADAKSWYQEWPADEFPHDPKPDGPRYAAMGDAVTVPVIEWIVNRLAIL